ISVDGNIANTWGLDWLDVAPGAHAVCFTHVIGYPEPACSSQTVTSGATTTLQGNFTQRGTLHAFTCGVASCLASDPHVAGTIFVDEIPRDDFEMFTDIPTGSHSVCFGPAQSYANTPACQTVTVT